MSGLPVLTNIECARQKIRGVIAGSQVSEDSRHADNTLEWLLRLEPDASAALQLAALGHDIDRAIEGLKVRRADFDNYDAFKAAHARNSAQILRQILVACDVERQIVDEACRLVRAHGVCQRRCSQMVWPSSVRLSFGNSPTVSWMSAICRRVRRLPKNVVDLRFSISGSIG